MGFVRLLGWWGNPWGFESPLRPWNEKMVISRQVCKSWKWFPSSTYLAAASGRGISSNLPVTFASDSALK